MVFSWDLSPILGNHTPFPGINTSRISICSHKIWISDKLRQTPANFCFFLQIPLKLGKSRALTSYTNDFPEPLDVIWFPCSFCLLGTWIRSQHLSVRTIWSQNFKHGGQFFQHALLRMFEDVDYICTGWIERASLKWACSFCPLHFGGSSFLWPCQ